MSTYVLRNVDGALWARMDAVLSLRPGVPRKDFIVHAITLLVEAEEFRAAGLAKAMNNYEAPQAVDAVGERIESRPDSHARQEHFP